MKTETIDYEKDDFKAHIVVSEATVLIGARRTVLRNTRARKDERTEEYIVRALIYPDLASPVLECEINGKTGAPTFEEFLRLPEPFSIQWEDAVYRLNPHWLPPESDEKKESETPTISTVG